MSRLPCREALHEHANALGVASGIQDQVYMIRHQAPGIHGDAECLLPLLQCFQIKLVVKGRDEYRFSIMSPLHYVMWRIGENDAGLPWHGLVPLWT